MGMSRMRRALAMGVIGGAAAIPAPTITAPVAGTTAASLTPAIEWTRSAGDPEDGSVTYTVTLARGATSVALDNAADLNAVSYAIDPTVGTVLPLSDTAYTVTVTPKRGGVTGAAATSTFYANLGSVGLARRYSSRGTLYKTTDTSQPVTADTDVVGRVNDSIAGTNNATQSGADATKPVYKTNIINGLPVLRFDGDAFLAVAGLDLLRNKASAEIIALVKYTNNDEIRWAFHASTSSTANTRAGLRITTVAYALQSRRLDADTTITSTGGTPDLNAWVVQTGVLDWTGGNQYLRLNGSQVDTDAYAGTGNSQDADSAGIRIGSTAGGSSFLIGDLIELLVWTPLPTDAVRDAVETYLASLVA